MLNCPPQPSRHSTIYHVWEVSRVCLGGGFDFFHFHPDPWGNDPIWRAYFSNGLVQPPTRYVDETPIDDYWGCLPFLPAGHGASPSPLLSNTWQVSGEPNTATHWRMFQVTWKNDKDLWTRIRFWSRIKQEITSTIECQGYWTLNLTRFAWDAFERCDHLLVGPIFEIRDLQISFWP